MDVTRNTLRASQEQKRSEPEKQGIWARLMKVLYKDLRAGPSGADPSSFLGTTVETEEDVLHVKELPSFGGKLGPQDVELLASYLTAPYLRIPLVLNFFATPEHLQVMSSTFCTACSVGLH